MKKILLIILLLMVVLLTAERVEIQYSFETPELTNRSGYDEVNFQNTRLSGIPGEPALPYHAVKLLLPVGHVAISVEFIGTGLTEISGNYELYPQQPDRPLSFGKNAELRVNEQVYTLASIYPENGLADFTTEFMNGYAILLASFTPVSYVPASGKISYYKNIKIVVETEIEQQALEAAKLLRPNALIDKMVQNPEMKSYYSTEQSNKLRDGEYHVLIITSETLEPGYSNYMEHYLAQGLKCEVATVNTIYNTMEGQDNAEKIRNYIIQEYIDNGIEQVVLGGDVEHVPYRGFYCGVQSSSWIESYDIPSDLYYSSLDGTWDDDDDGIWGEADEDDLLPDIAVGRMTVTSMDDLMIMINKSRSYQLTPVENEFNNPIFAGEHLYDDPLTYGGDYLDLLIGHCEENGYTTDGVPEDYPVTKFYDRDLGYWSAADIIARINEGYSFIHHVGHANSEYAMRLHISDITNENFSLVNGVDHNYSLIYSHGCTCGSFDYDDCIAEQMLNIENFAVGFVGNSRYGWFNEGQTEGPSAHIHREFVNALYTDKENRLGTAHMISKIETSPWVTAPDQHEEGALRWCFYDCNVLSDPLLPVWTDEPIEFTIDYPGVYNMTDGVIDVTVDSDSDLTGIVLTLVQDENLLGSEILDETGIASFVISIDLAETFIYLTISGYNTLPTSYEIAVYNSDGENINVQAVTKLLGNYPNPFNPNTTIRFNLKNTENVKMEVYNLRGQKIKTLVNHQFDAGEHMVEWSGEDDEGCSVASGIYLYKVKAGRYTATKKMILMK